MTTHHIKAEGSAGTERRWADDAEISGELWTRLHDQLLRRREELRVIERAVEKVERGHYTGDETGELGHLRLHDADMGSDEALREISARVAVRQIRELQAVEDAIARLETGRYGLCEDCEEPISVPRLIALPEVTRCVRCSERSEVEEGRRGRPSRSEDEDIQGAFTRYDFSRKGFQ